MSVNSTSPKTLFGGTWEQISQGRTLIGQGEIEANSDNSYGTITAGEWTATSGKKGGVVTRTVNFNHTHPQTHSFGSTYKDGRGLKYTDGESTVAQVVATQPSSWSGMDNPVASSKIVLNDKSWYGLPPYLVVYIWKRTA